MFASNLLCNTSQVSKCEIFFFIMNEVIHKMQDIIKKFKVDTELLYKVNKNIKQNELILKHYRHLLSEQKDTQSTLQIQNKIKRILGCNRFWNIDYFPKQSVKDFLGTFTCKEKFCSNCKKLKQAARMTRYIPEIEKLTSDYNMFHLVLTLPSVSGEELSKTIKSIFTYYANLNRYFRGDKKIRGVSFNQWGYVGGLRSLEVTYKGKMYHPHLHCLLICENNFLTDKNIENKYSLKFGKVTRKFSEEEILIQNIWYLLAQGVEVNGKNIASVELGYSCMIDKFKEADYAELFKYITKNDNGKMTYEQFNTLRKSLASKRQLQGYGVLHQLVDNDSEAIENEVAELYAEIRRELEANESPVNETTNIKELLLDNKNTLISKKRIYAFLRQRLCEEA